MTADHAFGLRLGGDLPLPGCAPGPAPPPARALELRHSSRAAVLAGWPRAATRDVHRRRHPATGRTVSLIQAHDDAGFLLRLDGHGAHRLLPGGQVALCGLPADGPAWRWQRYVVAQVLPFAALLQGLEVLHAGAFAVDGGAVAVTAPSFGGKSTLLAAAVAGGAPLVADDVLAVERGPDGDGVLVHPGPGLLSLRDDAAAVLDDAGAALGPRTGRGSPWRAVRRCDGSLPLRALAVLRRDPAIRRLAVRRQALRATELLGATFNAAWQERARLVRQLDVCAAIAADVPLLRLEAPPDLAPRDLAAALQEAVAAC